MPNQGTFVAGQVLTAAELNTFTPITVLTQSASQTVSTATFTTMLYNTETIDVSNWHSTATNTGRITPNVSGIYLATFNMPTGTTSTRNVARILKNGSELFKTDISATVTQLVSTTFVSMNGTTDYLETDCFQQSGTNAAIGPCLFTVMLVRLV
jgi:hypothetical protein